MSDLIALIRFDGRPVDPRELDPMLVQLARRHDRTVTAQRLGGDGFALAILPAGGPPEDGFRAERPVADAGTALALDGRLDDPPCVSPATDDTDARRLLAILRADSAAGVERLVGPFAFVAVEPAARRVLLGRDPFGGRPLFYLRRSEELLVASSVAALIAFEGRTPEPDEESVARYFAARGPRPGRTFFAGVAEVPLGAVLRIDRGSELLELTIRLSPAPRPGRSRESDDEARFRELLDLAVGCRVPRASRGAILMSGGLDSTAVAATAARIVLERPPLAISWIFDELPGADERRWIEAANRASGAQPRSVVGDELWPLSDDVMALDSPFASPYTALRGAAFAATAEGGATTLLTGESGDELWLGSAGWLRSLVGSGQWLTAITEAARGFAVEARGRRTVFPMRAALSALVGRRPGYGPAVEAPWLTDAARSALADDPLPSWSGLEAWRAKALVHSFDVAFLAAARREAAPHGLELRRPYRDRRVVEFFLSLPADRLFRPGSYKRLLRRALADRLPADVRERRESTTLLPLFDRGLGVRRPGQVRELLQSPVARWSNYVDRAWLWEHALPSLGSKKDTVKRVILWHCLCFERWCRLRRGELEHAADFP